MLLYFVDSTVVTLMYLESLWQLYATHKCLLKANSKRMTVGVPLHSMILSDYFIIRSDGNGKLTRIHRPSQLKSSITLNNQIARPHDNWSCKKSIDHSSFICFGTISACDLVRNRLFLGLIRGRKATHGMFCKIFCGSSQIVSYYATIFNRIILRYFSLLQYFLLSQFFHLSFGNVIHLCILQLELSNLVLFVITA